MKPHVFAAMWRRAMALRAHAVGHPLMWKTEAFLYIGRTL